MNPLPFLATCFNLTCKKMSETNGGFSEKTFLAGMFLEDIFLSGGNVYRADVSCLAGTFLMCKGM